MATAQRPDPDLPRAGARGDVLHLRAGRLLVTAASWLRPRITLGVRLVAFDDGGRVFLVQHSYLPGWHLPGGGVDPGETCREAVIREAREEGGLGLEEPPSLFGLYLNQALGNRDHVALFVARQVRPAREAVSSLEVRSAGFFDPDQLPEGATPATRARLAEVAGGRPQTEHW